MVKFCTNCGTENNDSAKFCEKCGEEFKSVQISEPEPETIQETVKEPVKEPVKETTKKTVAKTAKEDTDKKSKNNKIILLIIIGIVGITVVAGLVVVGMSFMSSDTSTQSNAIPFMKDSTVTKDFGGITMLVPSKSNFTQSYISPRSGSVGGFVTFNNSGQSMNDVYSITFSTVKGVQHPSNFVYQKNEGDVEIYRTGEKTYYLEKKVGDYTVSLIGGDIPLMLDMINSVQINNPTLNI